MAICSDLDETPDSDVYFQIAKYLNGEATTAMGLGVGLEVGNSIYFDMPPGQFSYWGTDDCGRAMARALIHSGHIDVLHSYGDLATTRTHAGRALDELERHGCRFEVWVDHSTAPTNFGPDIMAGRGDVVGDPAYHADLTVDYGIRYVWRGRTTGVLGQDAPADARTLTRLFDVRHPVGSAKSLCKEAVKVRLGRRGHPRWEMYAANAAWRPSALRDGRPVKEFLRSNPYWGGSGRGDTADGIADVLTERMLRGLVEREGVCILYTHLGKVRDPRRPFGDAARRAFERLAEWRRDGRILVTTTRRLLRYLAVRDGLRFTARRTGDACTVDVVGIDDPVDGRRRATIDELQGVTFVAPPRGRVSVRMDDGTTAPCEVSRQADSTFATVPWTPLVFPSL